MDAAEIHAKAVIAAALITSHAVEIPTLRKTPTHWTLDPAATRLRELTEFVYRTVTDPEPGSA